MEIDPQKVAFKLTGKHFGKKPHHPHKWLKFCGVLYLIIMLVKWTVHDWYDVGDFFVSAGEMLLIFVIVPFGTLWLGFRLMYWVANIIDRHSNYRGSSDNSCNDGYDNGFLDSWAYHNHDDNNLLVRIGNERRRPAGLLLFMLY